MGRAFAKPIIFAGAGAIGAVHRFHTMGIAALQGTREGSQRAGRAERNDTHHAMDARQDDGFREELNPSALSRRLEIDSSFELGGLHNR